MARKAASAVGASFTSMNDYLLNSKGDKHSKLYNVFAVFSSLQYRNTMYQQFKINRSEMWCLFALHGYLISHNKVLTSQDIFVCHLSGTFGTKRKITGYIKGLLTLRCIESFERVGFPDSYSIGISDYGVRILKAYFTEMNDLFSRFMGIQNKEKPVRYPDLEGTQSLSVSEDVARFYKRRAA